MRVRCWSVVGASFQDQFIDIVFGKLFMEHMMLTLVIARLQGAEELLENILDMRCRW